ncbi:NmrA family NAD(P)-binding protein [Nannocystis punicea]|uniref:NmrA family NAD(P)-binding protein n=1 Tax=Nannocystis punicea TaxID=2995304 RepID=A0ABY7HCF3_9BACT|nr:NmrA family NAD(P)-binding protein [Nannocystis poenicansa]WAS96944.1 NmrA family NAD(P)-binding protein [Nannocystis poenicansa]
MRGRILVTGATGNVGSAVLARLVARGAACRVGVRDPATAAARRDVEVVAFDFHRPETFRAAVAGAGGLFLVRPPAIADVRPSLCALVDAAAAAAVPHVVFLSVVGADRRRLIPHHAVEQHLTRGPVPWTILRPGFFAQNLGDAYRPDLRERDELFVPAGRGRVAWVDTRDLGELAADVLLDPGPHRGRAYTLTGGETRDFGEVAGLLARALGRPIRYTPAGALAYARRLHARGCPIGQVIVLTLLHLGLRRGDAERVDPTLAVLLGRPPRTIADYIADHCSLWQRAT